MAAQAEMLVKDGVAYVALPDRMKPEMMVHFQFFLLQAEDMPDVNRLCISIASVGGDFLAALVTLALMEKVVSKPISTVALGLGAHSSAVPLLLAGAKGHRWMLPSSRLMVHAIRLTPYAPMAPQTLHQKEQKRTRWYCKALAAGSLRSAQEWWEILSTGKDVFLSPEEALQLGMVDHIGLPPGFPGA